MKTYIVDSFTREPFKGNPAGVCIVEDALSDVLMLRIAQELGLSETAFIQRQDSTRYSIRYFSPKMEIPLCGHATLAASKILFENSSITEIQFTTIEKINLQIKRVGSEIQMEFPIYDTIPSEVPKTLLEALGIDEVLDVAYNEETHILLLEIASDKVLQKISPDYEALYRSHDEINGVLVTARSSDVRYDFQSRYFWPWSGTQEDPVTGGTHTFLAKYWADRLEKTKMESFQCSKRSGHMTVELLDDHKMTIQSSAVIVFVGELRL